MILSQKREAIQLLMKTVFMISKVADHRLQKETDFTLSQFKILMALTQNKGLTQKSIASFLGITEPAVSRQIEILRKKGLFEKKGGQLILTENGKKIVTKTFLTLDPILEQAFGLISTVELEKFKLTMKKIMESLIVKFPTLAGMDNCEIK